MKKLVNDHHIYDKVSSIYEALMCEVNYENWADYLKEVIGRFKIIWPGSGTCIRNLQAGWYSEKIF